MSIIEEMKGINEEIIDTALEYNATKLTIKENEANLFLYEDISDIVGKKPTQKDKEYHAFLYNLELHKRLYKSSCKYDKLKRDYEIKKLEAKLTGNFLNTVAGVVDDE